MQNSKISQKGEHKLYKVSFPAPETGVNVHWCYQNSTSYHKHDFYEFVIITEGKVKHVHNGKSTAASKGMLFLIKPGEYHQFFPIDDTPSKHINFSITPQTFEAITSAVFQDNVYEKINNFEIPSELFLPKRTLHNVFNFLHQIPQSLVQSQSAYVSVKTIILELTLSIINKQEALKTLAPHAPTPPVWLSDFLQTLNDPAVFTLKLKDIYPLAPYSQSMLNIYFNKYVGMTMITYITTLKISYACNLLRHTDASPLDISNQLAYDSLSHFNRVFKKVTGKSPVAYRKSMAA